MPGVYRKKRDAKAIDLRESSDRTPDSTDYETYLSECIFCRFNEDSSTRNSSQVFLVVGLAMITRNSLRNCFLVSRSDESGMNNEK